MNTKFCKNEMRAAIFSLAAVLAATTSYAGGGTDTGGGGDSTEARVDEIRSDILKWIDLGGAKGLILPSFLSYPDYVSRMSGVLAPHVVVVGFVSSAQESASLNEELHVSVSGQPKTCRGFVSRHDKRPHILCNMERFKGALQSDQYRLIHHEYAGLAGVERNQGPSSDYRVSNQLTDYLVPETILRLSVKKSFLGAEPPSAKFSEGEPSHSLPIGSKVVFDASVYLPANQKMIHLNQVDPFLPYEASCLLTYEKSPQAQAIPAGAEYHVYEASEFQAPPLERPVSFVEMRSATSSSQLSIMCQNFAKVSTLRAGLTRIGARLIAKEAIPY